MKTFTIAVIAGDGVGTEVIPQAMRILERIARKHDITFAFQDFDWGAEHFFRWGRMMPAGAIDLLQPCDAILLGAVGHPEITDHTTPNGLLVPIRRAFDQYSNVRPAYLYPGGAFLPLGTHDARRGHRPAATLRRHPSGRRGASGDYRPHHAQRTAGAHPPCVRPVLQCAAGVSLSGRSISSAGDA